MNVLAIEAKAVQRIERYTYAAQRLVEEEGPPYEIYLTQAGDVAGSPVRDHSVWVMAATVALPGLAARCRCENHRGGRYGVRRRYPLVTLATYDPDYSEQPVSKREAGVLYDEVEVLREGAKCAEGA